VSTDAQDLTAQREGLLALGVDPGRIYADDGLTGHQPGAPRSARGAGACREGDTLVASKLDRLARGTSCGDR
jgi:DNA invertase Pin-like site-specific DNA recombinase